MGAYIYHWPKSHDKKTGDWQVKLEPWSNGFLSLCDSYRIRNRIANTDPRRAKNVEPNEIAELRHPNLNCSN
jgi:hypothetical protein